MCGTLLGSEQHQSCGGWRDSNASDEYVVYSSTANSVDYDAIRTHRQRERLTAGAGSQRCARVTAPGTRLNRLTSARLFASPSHGCHSTVMQLAGGGSAATRDRHTSQAGG